MESDPLLGQRNGYAVAPGPWTKVKRRMGQSVDASKCGPALAVQCYIAGAADAAAYGYTKTWVAFMVSDIILLYTSARSSMISTTDGESHPIEHVGHHSAPHPSNASRISR